MLCIEKILPFTILRGWGVKMWKFTFFLNDPFPNEEEEEEEESKYFQDIWHIYFEFKGFIMNWACLFLFSYVVLFFLLLFIHRSIYNYFYVCFQISWFIWGINVHSINVWWDMWHIKNNSTAPLLINKT